MASFGVLKQVDLRLLWPKEAYDFSPWLAENIAALGDVLGLDLELHQQEAPVGPFSLDLLARDLGRDHTVIIENQIGPTDHDHLGKLLTYAAGYDAAVAVWIAATFRDEHRQALDWLNQRTDTTTEFFGLVVEAVQIDDSRPAPNFRLVASPNDWRKGKVTQPTDKPSPRGEAYRAFFQNLIDRLRDEHGVTRASKGQPQNWYSFASGVRGVVYSASFVKGDRVQAEAYLDNGDAAWNRRLFDALLAERSAIEADFGEPLDWQPMEGRQACRIAVFRPGTINDSPPVLEEITDWAIARLLRFRQVIGPRAQAAISAMTQTAPPPPNRHSELVEESVSVLADAGTTEPSMPRNDGFDDPPPS